MAVLLELPVTVVQGTYLSSFQPAADTVEVEGVVAHTPRYSTLLAGGAGLVSLTFNTQVHDVVPADSAVVYDDVPGPQRHRVPFLHFKPLLVLTHDLHSATGSLAVTVHLHS